MQNTPSHNPELEGSPLYSDDLAPVSKENRSWNMWHLAALWVGMAVCIPTYLLASYMMKSGLNWLESIIIIALGNIIITLPMVLNGHAGVKYGLPFPVIGRAAFGTMGVHVSTLARGLVACGWFGVQTWIGGLAFYAIYCAIADVPNVGDELNTGKFIGFGLFWLLNMYFVVKGSEQIKWLEQWAAPILVAIGIALIGWGWYGAGGFGVVLEQSDQLSNKAAVIAVAENTSETTLNLAPIKAPNGEYKADYYQLKLPLKDGTEWQSEKMQISSAPVYLGQLQPLADLEAINKNVDKVSLQFIKGNGDNVINSSWINAVPQQSESGSKLWIYVIWLTGMVGFWATMSISIADITRFAKSQKDQVMGQFIGLPGTMALYSFVGIFVTCAALINFEDVLIAEDAPWDPVSLLAKFDSPVVIVIAQIFMIIATLSTNIAANVIAPANAFANLAPKQLNFAKGGIITGIIGIIICPWWLLDDISGLLLFVSGFLGPILGVLMADYFWVRKKQLNVKSLFWNDGKYGSFNAIAFIALLIGVAVAMIGFLVPSIRFLYDLSWFVGFGVSFLIYGLMMKKE